MGATNKTPNIELPQFVGTDKPSWLGDFNGAMNTIDVFAGKTTGDIGTVTGTANAAKSAADAASASVTALETTVNQHTTEISDTMADVSSLEADVQQINTKLNSLDVTEIVGVSGNAITSENWNLLIAGTLIKSNRQVLILNTPFSTVFSRRDNIRIMALMYLEGNPLNLTPVTLTAGINTDVTCTQMGHVVSTISNSPAMIELYACYDSSRDKTFIIYNSINVPFLNGSTAYCGPGLLSNMISTVAVTFVLPGNI